MKITDIKEYILKQKVFLYFYKLKVYYYKVLFYIKKYSLRYTDSFVFNLILLCIFEYALYKILIWFNLNILDDKIYNVALTIAGIIGASIAIIFSFSTFILQSTSDLFSTTYLNKFIKDPKEKIIFWLLVLLTITSFLIPYFTKIHLLEKLILILFAGFYFIYILYKELRKRINPETTLAKIKDDAIKYLIRANKILKRYAFLHDKNKISDKDISLDFLYKENYNWKLVPLEDVKYLFEIGLRLLSKNEINSFNMTITYIKDIYIKHLMLRNGSFCRIPENEGTYSFKDEGFTPKIFEYLQSIGYRIIQEKRKENIYHLLNIYEQIFENVVEIKYVDKDIISDNPLLHLLLEYYIGYINDILNTKESDWIWESIKSLDNISNTIIKITSDYYVFSRINEIINKIAKYCLVENHTAFLKKILYIYFNYIIIAWDKYVDKNRFWDELFKYLKENILLLYILDGSFQLVGDLFMNILDNQINIKESICNLNDEKEIKEKINKYINLLNWWSNFLLDITIELGLENYKIGLQIIKSVKSNLEIIDKLKNKYKEKDLEKVKGIQFNILDHYFSKTDKVNGSSLYNLDEVLAILLTEICDSLKKNITEIERPVNLYVNLIEQHLEKVIDDDGYYRPKIILKLVYLSLLLHKYNRTNHESKILSKIDQLNEKYLSLKKILGLNKEKSGLVEKDEFQLCKEIDNLENRLFFSINNIADLESILRQEITKDDWDNFIKQIKCRKDK